MSTPRCTLFNKDSRVCLSIKEYGLGIQNERLLWDGKDMIRGTGNFLETVIFNNRQLHIRRLAMHPQYRLPKTMHEIKEIENNQEEMMPPPSLLSMDTYTTVSSLNGKHVQYQVQHANGTISIVLCDRQQGQVHYRVVKTFMPTEKFVPRETKQSERKIVIQQNR